MKSQRILVLSLALVLVPVLSAQVVVRKTTDEPAKPAGTPNELPSSKLTGQYNAPKTEAPKPVVIPDRKLTEANKMNLIRGMTAELGFARKPFPMGKTGLKLEAKDGKITPDDEHLEAIMAGYGPAIKPGDRATITNVKFKDKSIVFEINGGPVKKKKWYQHIQVSGMGGTVTPGQPDSDNQNLHGTMLELDFDKFVPDVNTEQVKQLLDPVLNFHAKSATEAYLDTIPKVAKAAIQDHHALVGMNREMVTYAKGRPPQKLREKDASGDDYEEWIYGTPPQEVEFIRFIGDQVVRIETMKVDGHKVVRTQPEVVLPNQEPEVAQGAGEPGVNPPPGPATAQPTPASTSSGPIGKPSLRRPGEDTAGQPAPSSPGQAPPLSPTTAPTPPDGTGPKPPVL